MIHCELPQIPTQAAVTLEYRWNIGSRRRIVVNKVA